MGLMKVSCLGLGLSLLLSSCSLVAFLPSQAQTAGTLAQAPQPQGQMLPIKAEAMIGGRVIKLEVTETPEQQAMGLMYRTSLPDDRGMLFSFDPPRPVRFWMKNCQMSLDMLFLRDGAVQAIAAKVPPCQADPCPTYGPDLLVDRVIELRNGRAAELGVKVGDRIAIQFLDAAPTSGPSPQGKR